MGTASEVYERIFDVVRAIPKGEILTYGEVAKRVGMYHGARQVGYAMRRAPDDIPWHRVVGLSRNGFGRISISDPMIAELQRQLLITEGAVFDENGEVQLNF